MEEGRDGIERVGGRHVNKVRRTGEWKGKRHGGERQVPETLERERMKWDVKEGGLEVGGMECEGERDDRGSGAGRE